MNSGVIVWYRIVEYDFIHSDIDLEVKEGDLVPAIVARAYSEKDLIPYNKEASPSVFSGFADLYVLVPGTPYWKAKAEMDYNPKETSRSGSLVTQLPEKGKFTNAAPAPLYLPVQ